ncbi:MAG TPA: DUF1059 domain-containing protein [Candidatus Paceibacterota bacterium]|nr:DUF1059 domain-containing protein [Candidatus Paceibacterota bacterium]
MAIKTLLCSNISGNPDCAFEARGEANDDVVNAMFEHALLTHREKFETMSEQEKEEMIERMNLYLDEQGA